MRVLRCHDHVRTYLGSCKAQASMFRSRNAKQENRSGELVRIGYISGTTYFPQPLHPIVFACQQWSVRVRVCVCLPGGQVCTPIVDATLLLQGLCCL